MRSPAPRFRLPAAAALLLACTALALAGGRMEIRSFTVDGGGGTLTGTTFELSGSIGQPDAGPALSSASFELSGGFWTAPAVGGPACPGDVTGDGVVDVQDMVQVILDWGQGSESPSDVDGNGIVDVADLVGVILGWGPCPAPAGCGSGAGGCCLANGTPGCEDPVCCGTVCAADPFCCETKWDGACAAAAQSECECPKSACGPGSGTCCAANGTPGCEDVTCCETVCATDAFCCDTEWDGLCADMAQSMCKCSKSACGPGSGSCCFPNGTPGCEDVSCCETVCAVDPFCCDVDWDGLCADIAEDLCGCP